MGSTSGAGLAPDERKPPRHDPEKCEAVFPRDKRMAFARRSCPNKELKRDDDSSQNHRALGKPMTTPLPGGVDCDLHPAVPHLTSLLPYMNDYWRDQVTTRDMVGLV